MPDVDRFERTLRGLYWRKAYRLSFSDENSLAFRDTVTKACAAYLRKAFPSDCLRKCPTVIYEGLRDKATKGPTGSNVFLEFTKELEQFDSEERDFAATEIIKTVAQTVFADLEAHSSSITPSTVEQAFSKQLIERVIRHCFLARVRDGIALKRRGIGEQVDWEREVISDVSARAEKMLRAFFRNRRGVIKAPKRLTPQRRMTIEELNKGLTVTEV